MTEMTASEWLNVPGRGRIAIVHLGDAPSPTVGSDVTIDGGTYVICGVERGRTLMDPPQLFPQAGLLVRERDAA